MEQSVLLTREGEPQISLIGLAKEAWRSKWLVIAILFVFSAIGVTTALLMKKQYRAQVLLAPVTESPTSSGGGLSALASQYGDLASLAGISVGGHETAYKDEILATLQSEQLTEQYIRANDLLPILFANSWDPVNKKWKTTDPKKIPTLWRGNQAFKKIRELKQDRQSTLVTLSITWTDPVLAAQWATDLVNITNTYMRSKAIKESENNVTYLTDQAAKTNVVEAKMAMYTIMKGEINKLMIANGRQEYALKVIDPARVPESPSSMSRTLVSALAFLEGLIIAAFVVFRRHMKRLARTGQ